MAKRKYTRSGEQPLAYKCTNKKCGWEGTFEQKKIKHNPTTGWDDYVCPNCLKNEFYGLLEIPNSKTSHL